MRIANLSGLIDGKKYWHLYVECSCHWKIGVKSSNYKQGQNWDNMIVFDAESEARLAAQRLQNTIGKLIII